MFNAASCGSGSSTSVSSSKSIARNNAAVTLRRTRDSAQREGVAEDLLLLAFVDGERADGGAGAGGAAGVPDGRFEQAPELPAR